MRNLRDVADERPVALAHGRDAGERCAVRVRPVVREAPRDDHGALWLALERPVAPDDLGGGVDGLAAAGAEEDGGVLDRGEVGDPLCEVECRAVRVVAEDVVRRQRAELLGDGVGDLDAAMADVAEPETGRRVEVLVPVGVPDPAPLAAGEDELVPVDLSHRRKRMPETGWGARHGANVSRCRARPG